MECFFINLDGERDRRALIESNFAVHAADGWRLNRVAAVDVAGVRRRNMPGGVRDTEKGCFLSHRKAVEQSLLFDDYTMILEDDAMFGAHSCACIAEAIDTLAPESWDILYTDLIVADPGYLAGLLRQRRQACSEGSQQVLDLASAPYSGATAYVLNPRFSARLLQLISIPRLDAPYDLYLRALVLEKHVRAFATFPYATSVSLLGDRTQIQWSEGKEADMSLVYNALRRFLWIDRDLASCADSVAHLGDKFVDAETAVFMKILGPLLSPNSGLG